VEVPSRLISPSLIWAGVGILGLVIWPFLIGQYWLQITIVSGVFVILAVSLNLIMGIAGQLSIAHAAFYGIGAYTSALLTLRLGLSFWVSLPLAMVFTAFLGYLIAIPALRLRGHYLAIVTLGFGVLIYQVLERWESMTRGVMALTGIPRPTPFLGITFRTKLPYYYLLLILIGIVVFVVHRIVNSRVGLALKSVREDEVSARALGVNTYHYKVAVFAVGTALAGIAGGFHAHYQRVLAPDEFSFVDSVRILMMVIVGGMGSVSGSILGALVLIWLPEILRAMGDFRDLVYGLAVILIVIFIPGGLMEMFRRSVAFLQRQFGLSASGDDSVVRRD